MEYHHRIVDDELDVLLTELPAIGIEGPRGVGKTATASRRVDRVIAFDDPPQLEVISADPTQLDAFSGRILLDEWQRYPPIWDYVRRQVDAGSRPGRFLLAGSAAPLETPTHSGAGRISQLRMRPLGLAERGFAPPTVKVHVLLQGEHPPVAGSTDVKLLDYAEEIVASGFPGIRPLSQRARNTQLQSYINRVVQRDFAYQGLRVRRPASLLAWLRAYAAATATTTSYNLLARAASLGGEDIPAKTTVAAYRDVLTDLWLLDPIPGWSTTRNRLRRLTLAPKHHLADPALAARLLGVGASGLIEAEGNSFGIPRDGSLLGALFESLVALSVRVYAQASEASVFHLRTKDNRHEVDLIVERPDGRVLALEVKLSREVGSADVRHLHWLREEIGDDLLDAVVVTAGAQAYRRTDGIAVVPAVLLGP